MCIQCVHCLVWYLNTWQLSLLPLFSLLPPFSSLHFPPLPTYSSPLPPLFSSPLLSQPPLPDQIKKPINPFPESEPSREIACHLTVYDWNLFFNIHQMEFIYQVFGRHRFSKITSNLDLLIRRFNELEFWVVTEICNEPLLQKRVKILVKFIKIASQ